MTCPQCGTLNEDSRDACVRCSTRLHDPAMAGKIACFNHANREATTACASCGHRLCADCAANANGVDFCTSCAPANAVAPAYDEAYSRLPIVDPATSARASFGSRLFAGFLDALIIAVGAVVIALLFWPIAGGIDFLIDARQHAGMFYLYRTLVLAGSASYFVILTAMTGQTFGMQIAGVIVLDTKTGGYVSLQTAAIRWLASIVSLIPLGLGYVWMLWDADGETWHDKVSKTRAFRWEETA